MTDESSSQIGTTVKYLPFGEARAAIDIPTDKLFTGQRLDSIGLYYYNARYYDATIGRFISADTIIPNPANPQSFNSYSYCLNNPLKYIDPSGNNDVTVTTQPFTPEQEFLAYLLGYDLDTLYVVTDSNGSQTAVAANDQGPGIMPGAVYDAANRMRQEAGDNELNIIMLDENNSTENAYLNRFVYDDSWSHDVPIKWGKYVHRWTPFDSELHYIYWDLYESYEIGPGKHPGPSGWDVTTTIMFGIGGLVALTTPVAPWGLVSLGINGVKFISIITGYRENPDMPMPLVIPKP